MSQPTPTAVRLGMEWGSTPHGSSKDQTTTGPAMKNASSISRPGGTAGWLWNFRLDDVGRWHDSELLSLGGQLDHNDPGLQLEESTSRFQCKKTDSEAAGHHKTTGPILRTCSAEQATTAGD